MTVLVVRFTIHGQPRDADREGIAPRAFDFGRPYTVVFDGHCKVCNRLVGALRTCMGVCGAATIPEMHKVEMVIAPAIKTEGKSWQLAGAL